MTTPIALPAAGGLSPNFVGCGSVLQGFVINNTTTPTFDSSQFPVYGNLGTCGGVGAESIFVLEVPRHFRVPSTQQWNLTVQKQFGSNCSLIGMASIKSDFDNDGVEDIVIPAHCTSPMHSRTNMLPSGMARV